MSLSQAYVRSGYVLYIDVYMYDVHVFMYISACVCVCLCAINKWHFQGSLLLLFISYDFETTPLPTERNWLF